MVARPRRRGGSRPLRHPAALLKDPDQSSTCSRAHDSGLARFAKIAIQTIDAIAPPMIIETGSMHSTLGAMQLVDLHHVAEEANGRTRMSVGPSQSRPSISRTGRKPQER